MGTTLDDDAIVVITDRDDAIDLSDGPLEAAEGASNGSATAVA